MRNLILLAFIALTSACVSHNYSSYKDIPTGTEIASVCLSGIYPGQKTDPVEHFTAQLKHLGIPVVETGCSHKIHAIVGGLKWDFVVVPRSVGASLGDAAGNELSRVTFSQGENFSLETADEVYPKMVNVLVGQRDATLYNGKSTKYIASAGGS